MNPLEFLSLSLATWRLSSLLVEEEGPFCCFSRLRDLAGVRQDDDGHAYGENELGYILSCIWCTSLWVGLFWFVFWLIVPRVAVYASLPFSLTAATALIHGRGVRYRKK